MSVAVLSGDCNYSQRMAEQILNVCMEKGCYTSFVPFHCYDEMLAYMAKSPFEAAVIASHNTDHFSHTHRVRELYPELKIVLMTNDSEVAVNGYKIGAVYCTDMQPDSNTLAEIATVLFEPESVGYSE